MKENAPCLSCKHLSLYDLEHEGKMTCPCFSTIPQDILDGTNNHTTPHENQVLPYLYERTEPPIEPLFVDEKAYKKHWSPCSYCKHFDRETCPAFDEIPLELVRITRHKTKFEGQNKSDVVFEKK